MLQIFEDCPALKELVSLASGNQPKNYRILDEPTPLGAFERSNPNFEKNLIEVKWWQSDRGETVYFIRPAKGNFAQVAVRIPGERPLNGPALDSSFAEMQALTKKAHEEVASHKELDLPFEHEKKSRVIVTYGGGPNESFYVDGALTKLLTRIEECPALKKLLLLVSKGQPKEHRILDN